MASRFVPVCTDEFVYYKTRSCGLAKHKESHAVLFNSVQSYSLKLFLMNKITKSVYSVLSPPQRLFILFIMFFGSLRIVLGVNRDRAPKRTEEHYK